MKQTLETVKTYKLNEESNKYTSSYTTERFVTYQGYKFLINSSKRHAIDMKAINQLEFTSKPPFKTTHLETMLKCLIDARNNLNNPTLTHITLHLNNNYTVSDITERLKRIAKDEIRYVWSLEDKEGNVHIHLYLIIDIPNTELNINNYINNSYTDKLKCSALKDIYNTQYKENKPYYNLKKDDEFVKAVHYASYATKQTNKSSIEKGVRSFGTSKMQDRNQLLKLENFYAIHEYFEEIPLIDSYDDSESFRLALTIEKAGTYTNVYWSVRDFNLLPTTTPENLVLMLDNSLNYALPSFIQKHKLYLHPDDNIIEYIEVLPTLNQYKKKTTEHKETVIEAKSKHVPLIATFEDELLELVSLHLEDCLRVKD